jgi:hypothetical protein
MAFAFLLVILSDKGKEITKDCFQKEDAPEPNFDWTMAPGMDYNNMYHPPVLAKVNLQSDDESDDSSCSSISTSSTTEDEDPANDNVDNLAPKKKDEKKPVKMTCS